jgi:hypothetical protein
MNELFNQWDVVVILLQIIAIDLLLGGDNAVVIAMACRKLPPQQRTKRLLLAPSAPSWPAFCCWPSPSTCSLCRG